MKSRPCLGDPRWEPLLSATLAWVCLVAARLPTAMGIAAVITQGASAKVVLLTDFFALFGVCLFFV